MSPRRRDGGSTLVGEAVLVAVSFGRRGVGRAVAGLKSTFHPIIWGPYHGDQSMYCVQRSFATRGYWQKTMQASKRTYRRHLIFDKEKRGKKMI